MLFFFFFHDTATTEIYTLSLHDALPISSRRRIRDSEVTGVQTCALPIRAEEHTAELQSPQNRVCRLLLGFLGPRLAAGRHAVFCESAAVRIQAGFPPVSIRARRPQPQVAAENRSSAQRRQE